MAILMTGMRPAGVRHPFLRNAYPHKCLSHNVACVGRLRRLPKSDKHHPYPAYGGWFSRCWLEILVPRPVAGPPDTAAGTLKNRLGWRLVAFLARISPLPAFGLSRAPLRGWRAWAGSFPISRRSRNDYRLSVPALRHWQFRSTFPRLSPWPVAGNPVKEWMPRRGAGGCHHNSRITSVRSNRTQKAIQGWGNRVAIRYRSRQRRTITSYLDA